MNPPNQQVPGADYNVTHDGPETWLPINDRDGAERSGARLMAHVAIKRRWLCFINILSSEDARAVPIDQASRERRSLAPVLCYRCPLLHSYPYKELRVSLN